MRWLVEFDAYVRAHSRVQFHPAAFALLYSVFFVVLMAATLFVMSLIFEASRSSRFALDYVIACTLFSPLIFGELVRGHVKTWIGCRPEEWCFPAMGIAGLTAGGVFGALMALRWGRPLWLELLGWGGGAAVVYPLLGWLIRRDLQQKAGKGAATS